MKSVAEWLQTDDQMCVDIVDRKYLLEEDILGHKETIDELLDRVSGGNREARKLIKERKFIPGGRIIANRGLTDYGLKVTYSNCYVDPAPQDNIESIYNTCSRLARTFSYGGGIGIDISKLAPAGAKVNNTARNSTGAISFVNTFSEVAETIGMKGRRGALMISIDGHHPDLKEFITHKSDLGITQGANMSVRMTDDFFEAVKNDDDWVMSFTRPETGETITKKEKARDIMYLIAKTNWDYAEPGLIYWDTMTKYNLMSEDPDFEYAGTNPCGEEPLPAGGSCLLGAMNLSEYWRNNNRFAFGEFCKDVKTAVRFLNEVLDEGEPLHPLKEQRDTVKTLRQIGLGFMGLGDLFIKARVRYGSKESIELCHEIGYKMIFSALQESAQLAKKYGSFDNCNPDLILKSKFFIENVYHNPYYSVKDIDTLVGDIICYGLRNSQLLTCAPTGTTSTIFNVSGGIEPIFALKFTRTTKSIYNEDRTYEVYPNGVKYFLERNGYKSLDEVEEFPDYLVTSRDIDWQGRIDVQAAWQEHIDASISATINLPESTTVEEVADLYIYAHDAGIKGTTVFRENCKRIAILNDSFKKKNEKEEDSAENEDIESMAKTVLDKAINGTGLSRDLVLGSNTMDALGFIKHLIRCNIGESKETVIEHKAPADFFERESKIQLILDICLKTANVDKSKLSEESRETLYNAAESMYEVIKLMYDSDDIIPDDVITDHLKKCLRYYPKNGIPVSNKNTSIGDKGCSDNHPKGVNESYDYIQAIKDQYKGDFNNILTRADFSSALHGTTYYKRVACGHIYITVNRYQGRPVEVFMQSSKSGGCSANTEALGRMASTMLRAGIDPDIVVDSVMGVKCAACSSLKGKGEAIDGLSCSDVMARVIKEEYQKYKDGIYDNEIEEWLSTASYEEKWTLKHGTNNWAKGCICDTEDVDSEEQSTEKDEEKSVEWNYEEHTDQENIDHYVCPNCGDSLLFSEGCMKCLNCGFSKC